LAESGLANKHESRGGREPENLRFDFGFKLSAFSLKLIRHVRIRKGGAIMTISQELLDILACPKCKGDIYLNETKDGLICDRCKLLYEIKDDIPIMLIDEAKPIES
jgi:uncharacterized protein YbaR (Trm112 family)